MRRVMFDTDNWEDCITEAVWFGQKIPLKRRHVGRQAQNHKDPVATFFEGSVSLDTCKERLLTIAETYMKASIEHDREWDEESNRQGWAQKVKDAT